MARSIWTGVISFGLVSVPVAMFTATEEHEVSFHQFERGTSDRIRYHRVNERTGKEVEYDDIVKGADVGDDQYVMLDPQELEDVAPGRSRSLDIHRFVELGEIDPVYYQKAYYLQPGSDETVKTYVLLRDAMADAGRAAIATLVMRGKEYLAAIRPDGDLLVLETMYFADEVRDPRHTLERYPGRVSVSRQELRMADQLLESLTGPWKPADYHDTYTERVRQLIDAKVAGNEITAAEPAPEATGVTNLLEVLRRSVEAARSGRNASTAKPAWQSRASKPSKVSKPSKPSKVSKTSESEGKQRGGSAKRTGTATKKAGNTKAGNTKAGNTKAGNTKAGAKRPAATGRDELAGKSKAELMKLAGDLDVRGRSSMDRAALQHAVATARKPARRSAA